MRHRTWVALSLSALLTTGCLWVEDTTDLRQFISATLAKPGGKIEPLPEFKPYESFVYEGSSLRDPFKRLVPESEADKIAGPDSGIKPDDDRPKDYLEEFAIDQLNMVGTITPLGSQSLYALVRDNKGEIHRVTVGDHMGLDYGEVVEVSDHAIKLVEIISNGRGGWMTRPRNLAMPEQE
ncbi:Type IV pilus biogenesis protein PilP [Marinobacterium lacunae]|uniref:Type IV pilus biogenesis protein PilP n=1 Tax=Marinobacterium lacunae TaxID=1232683 RepID=A0A081G2S8_9GAMM|nr:Type IV pilus biogenesis protein PilP [Marinobacterium lacunae]